MNDNMLKLSLIRLAIGNNTNQMPVKLKLPLYPASEFYWHAFSNCSSAYIIAPVSEACPSLVRLTSQADYSNG